MGAQQFSETLLRLELEVEVLRWSSSCLQCNVGRNVGRQTSQTDHVRFCVCAAYDGAQNGRISVYADDGTHMLTQQT
jgi:hypothetical protein